MTISLTALLVWSRQLERLRERLVSKMVKPKPSLLAATVTQGQDTGHHVELQQPQTRGPTYVLRSSSSAPTSLHTLKSPWGAWGWSMQTVPLFTGTPTFYLHMFCGEEWGKCFHSWKRCQTLNFQCHLELSTLFFSAVLGPPRGTVFSRCGVRAPQLWCAGLVTLWHVGS